MEGEKEENGGEGELFGEIKRGKKTKKVEREDEEGGADKRKDTLCRNYRTSLNVRKNRFQLFGGNTQNNCHSFDFHGRPEIAKCSGTGQIF
jgi:hypothetical protein